MIDRHLDLGGLGAEVLEDVHHQRVVFAQEANEKMLGSHVLVVAAMCLVARSDQGPADPGGEIVAGQTASSSRP
jgi:hypothetical protein